MFKGVIFLIDEIYFLGWFQWKYARDLELKYVAHLNYFEMLNIVQ